MSKTEQTTTLSEADAAPDIGVVGLEYGKSASRVAALPQGSDAGPAWPVGLRGMLCPYSLKHFLLGL
ncbi:hypothetical protein SBA5_880035 [Candidatus Sulfotelmatomonas gaucii]|uniref:Uncharacterized protein n=1 Tax=Candidatus Sulfuritelmatomonas gaucii TaxID=2043161 RepID=A0A2N9M7G9_9BACT|nr:hypothetical protein SBA5_880035 [Candidatus Sulfotelmatomonas gaucii]